MVLALVAEEPVPPGQVGPGRRPRSASCTRTRATSTSRSGAPRVEVRQEKARRGPARERPARRTGASRRRRAATEPRRAEPSPRPSRPRRSPSRAPKPDRRSRAEKQDRQRKAEKKARKASARPSKVKRWVQLTVPVDGGPAVHAGRDHDHGQRGLPRRAAARGDPAARGAGPAATACSSAGVERIRAALRGPRAPLRHGGPADRAPPGRERRRRARSSIDEDEPYYVARIEFTRQHVDPRPRAAARDAADRGRAVQPHASSTCRDSQGQPARLLPGRRRAGDRAGGGREPGQHHACRARSAAATRSRSAAATAASTERSSTASTRRATSWAAARSSPLALQVGGRSNRYQLSFQEPWFLGRPYLFGVSVFRRDCDYGGTACSSTSTRRRSGPRPPARPLRQRQPRLQLARASRRDGPGRRHATRRIARRSAPRTDISSITPVFAFSTINNPYRPSARARSFSRQPPDRRRAAGRRHLVPQAGRPVHDLPARASRKSFLGRSTPRPGWCASGGDGSLVSASNIEGVPRYERFWLGGDTLGPRVFETRTITPLRYVVLDDDRNIIDVLGDPRYVPAEDLVTSGGVPVLIEVGGDRFFLLQSEYVMSAQRAGRAGVLRRRRGRAVRGPVLGLRHGARLRGRRAALPPADLPRAAAADLRCAGPQARTRPDEQFHVLHRKELLTIARQRVDRTRAGGVLPRRRAVRCTDRSDSILAVVTVLAAAGALAPVRMGPDLAQDRRLRLRSASPRRPIEGKRIQAELERPARRQAAGDHRPRSRPSTTCSSG